MKWQLQTAKAKLSELIRKVDAEGPQTITVHGAREYVVVPKDEFDRLTAANDRKPFESALDLFRPILGLGVDLELPSRAAEQERPNPFDDPDGDESP